MTIISRKTHGILDYFAAAVLIASPWLFDFHNDGAQTIIPIVLGLATILYSLITAYEYGLKEVIPFSTHLILDVVSGLFLAASPWIFGFNETVYIPHVALGMIELTVVLLTGREHVPVSAARAVNKPRTSTSKDTN